MYQQTLIITGMHRSGTSLITSWLNRCGLHVGEQLEAANTGNVKGHFEDLDFLKLHEGILEDNSIPASGIADIHDIDISVYQLEKMKSVINVKKQLYEQWAWKDPRTCLFLDTYKQLIPNAKYLVIIRDHESVVSSLLRREFAVIDNRYMERGYFSRQIWKYLRRSRREQKFNTENAERFLKVWLAYNEEILNTIKRLRASDYLVTNYTQLLENDNNVFSYLTGNWQLDLSYHNFKEVYQETLMGEPMDINSLITNRVLLIKANYLQIRLNRFMQAD